MKRKFISKTIISLVLATAMLPLQAAGVTDGKGASGVNAAGAESESAAEIAEIEELVVAKDAKGNKVPLSKVDEDAYDGYLFGIEDSATKTEKKEIRQAVKERPDDESRELIKNEIYSADSLETIGEVADADQIDYIEPNYIVHAMGTGSDADENDNAGQVNAASGTDAYTPNDSSYGTYIDYFNLVDIQDAWASGVKGSGKGNNDTPVVAVIDTGLMGTGNSSVKHEDINYENVIAGKCYDNGKASANTNDGEGHGTFVAGEIAEIMDNGKGVCGMMPDVKICPIKALDDSGYGTVEDTVLGINYAVSIGADVINMSLGASYSTQSEETACAEAADAGIIVVAAAGNDGDTHRGSAYEYPASYDGVISVASVDYDGDRAYYSQYNNRVDVAAPGSNIYGLSISSYSSYRTMVGTSMATPVVAAFAAMAKSLDSDIDHDEFMTLLANTCTDKGSSGRDNYYGYGIVDFAKAMDTMQVDIADSSAGYEIELEYDTYAYNGGNPVEPEVTIDGLEEDRDYTVSYENNTAVTTASPATVTATGTGAYKGTLTKEFEIGEPCSAHNLIEIAAKASTCTEDGNCLYYTCQNCGRIYADAEGTQRISAADCVIPAAHKWSDEWSSDASYHWHKCTAETVGEDLEPVKCTEISDKAAHTWDSGTVTKSATSTETGIREYKCTVCGYTREETIAATGYHNEYYVEPTPEPEPEPEPEIVDPGTEGGTVGVDLSEETELTGDASTGFTAETTIDEETAEKIVDSATKNKSTEILISAAVDTDKTVNESEVTIPSSIVNAAGKNDAILKIETNIGTMSLDTDTIGAMAEKDADSMKVDFAKSADSTDRKSVYDLNIELAGAAGTTSITELGGTAGFTAPLPAELKEADSPTAVYFRSSGDEQDAVLVNGAGAQKGVGMQQNTGVKKEAGSEQGDGTGKATDAQQGAGMKQDAGTQQGNGTAQGDDLQQGTYVELVPSDVAEGRISMKLTHLSTYGVMSGSDADALFKASAESTTMGSLTLKNYSNGKIKATWSNGIGNTDCIGQYQVVRATDSKFRKNVRKYTTENCSYTLTKSLKKGKTYYLKVRASIIINGQQYWSAWSKAKHIKCRKTRK